MMNENEMMRALEIMTRNNVPRGVSLYTDFKELTRNLMDYGLDSKTVSHLINILRAGLTLKIDWKYLEDYDRQEVQSRVTRRTMLKSEIVADIMDVLFRVCTIKDADEVYGLSFRVEGDVAAVYGRNELPDNIEIPKLVLIDDFMYVVRIIGNSAFKGCKSLASIQMPDSITTIGEGAFEGCKMLNDIEIPDSVDTIGNRAFSWCTSLSYIDLPDSIRTIGAEAFRGCEALVEVRIPGSVTSMDKWVFYGCTALTMINVAPDNKEYYSHDGILFDKNMRRLICYPTGKQDETFTLPDTVTSIDERAFRGCRNIVNIEIPDSVTDIGAEAFSNCEALTGVRMSESVSSFGKGAFYDCTALTSFEIPESVTEVDEWAFYGCTALTSMNIPDSVTSIGAWAFYGCTALTRISIPDSVTSIGEDAFKDCTSLNSSSRMAIERFH